ncbi:MAG: sulfotransferase domain-containing protein [Anaerolineales bacterium]|nr:sulfotransferase domain-containing protein [Anaerolineales bacterium]
MNRDATIEKILDYIEGFDVEFPCTRLEAINAIRKTIQPKKAGTFRKGQPGNWREHFTPENKIRFKRVAGDLLTKLGYEENDQDW